MKDYTNKLNSREKAPSMVQEPTLAMAARPTTRHTGKRGDSKTMLEMSMACFFSEEELDEEIRVSMKSGNATQHEIDAVFCR